MSKRFTTILIIVLVLILISASLALAYYIIGSNKIPTNPPSPQAITTAFQSASSVSPNRTNSAPLKTETAAQPSSTMVSPTSEVSPTFEVVATITPVPTETSQATPSATLSMTKTPDPDICSRVNIQFRRSTSNIALWQLNNMNFQPAGITRISLTWPKQNQAVFNAFLEGNVIWSGGDLASPTIISDWIGSPSDREVLGSTRLEFLFGTDAASSGYEITVELDNGCSTTSSN